jgi:hypothetical protein
MQSTLGVGGIMEPCSRYTFMRPLAQLGSLAVYECEDQSTRTSCIVASQKSEMVSPDHPVQDGIFLLRRLHEAKAVKIIEEFEESGNYFIVLEQQQD